MPEPTVQQGDADAHRGKNTDGGDGDSPPVDPGDDSGGLPVPSLSRRQAAIGLVVVLGVLLYLRWRQASGSGNASPRSGSVGTPDDLGIEDQGGPADGEEDMNIEENPNDPLQQDEQFIQESGAFDSLARED